MGDTVRVRYFGKFNNPKNVPMEFMKRYEEGEKPKTGDLIDSEGTKIKTSIFEGYARTFFIDPKDGGAFGSIFKNLETGVTYIRNYDGWYIDEDSDGLADGFVDFKDLKNDDSDISDNYGADKLNETKPNKTELKTPGGKKLDLDS